MECFIIQKKITAHVMLKWKFQEQASLLFFTVQKYCTDGITCLVEKT